MTVPVSFENISLSYGDVTALDGVTTAFEAGLNVVLGPNGAGKTTLFRVGAGVLPPDSGAVLVDGTDPFADQSVKARVGYLPHGTPLNPRLSVADNLDYWGRIIGIDAATRAERIGRVAETADVDDLLDRRGSDLSRGQRQRVTIARLLLGAPTSCSSTSRRPASTRPRRRRCGRGSTPSLARVGRCATRRTTSTRRSCWRTR